MSFNSDHRLLQHKKTGISHSLRCPKRGHLLSNSVGTRARLTTDEKKLERKMLKVVGASWEKTRLATIMLGAMTAIAIFVIIFFDLPLDHNDGNYAATAFWSQQGHFSVKFWGQGNDPGTVPTGVARAYYRTHISKTGWATLEIQSQSEYPDWVQAYSTGILEGSLTWQLIFWQWQNSVAFPCEARKDFCYKLRNYLLEASSKIRKIANETASTDPVWHQVNLFFYQLDGIETGWRYGVARSRRTKIIDIPKIDFLLMNALSDLRDLEFKYNETEESDFRNNPFSISILKLLPGTEKKFLLAHASSGYYTDMLRIQKKYTFGFHEKKGSDSLIPAKSIEFTSYPAAIHSQDDFYHVNGDRKFIIAGTAIRNYNDSLWEETDINKLLLGPRVMAANRLSRNQSEWGKILGYGNSGIGLKQWLVLNPQGKSLKIQLIEQIPGKTISEDITQVIKEKGFWMSYGLPYYKEILDVIGYKKASEESDIDVFFERISTTLLDGQKNITDVHSLISLMRSPNMAMIGRSDVRHLHPITMSNFSQSFHKEVRKEMSAPLTESNKSQNQETHSFINKLKLFVELERNKFSGNVFNMDPTEEEGEEDDHNIALIQNVQRRTLNGNIDLKITSGEGKFNVAAGPPYSVLDGVYEVEPFKWSVSLFKDLPHYGQVDEWKFDPIEPQWVWYE